ncbi:phage protein [Proteus mirabilis]|nr:phage protein [Proteus mirabilis]
MSINNVDFTRPEYKTAAPQWALVRSVCRGGEDIKSYLPELEEQDNKRKKKRNKDYQDRAVFYPITGNTRNGMIGMAFKKDPLVAVTEKLSCLRDDADGAGSSIYQLAQSSLESILEVGRHGLYVDYNSDSKLPYIFQYQAEDIINWRADRINGRTILTLVVLREMVEEEDGFGFKDTIQYRVLAIEDGKFICRVYRKPAGSSVYQIHSEYIPERAGNGAWDEIPFTFIGAQNNDHTIDEAPLLGLAKINLGHYRNSADYEDSVFFCGQVQPYIGGLNEQWRDWLQEKGVMVGSRSPILLPDKGSYGYVQAQPNMLAKEAMDSKRDYMVALGAQLVSSDSKVKTIIQSVGEQSAQTSILSICCSNVSDAFSKALMWCAEYLGLDTKDTSFEINKDLVNHIADSSMIREIVAAWQSGATRKSDLVRSLQKYDVIDPADDVDMVVDELNNQEPTIVGET